MPRVSMNSETSPAASQPLLEQIDKAFGTTPNMFKAVSNSPAALKSMWGAFGALAGGTLGARLGEQIAVAIANRILQQLQSRGSQSENAFAALDLESRLEQLQPESLPGPSPVVRRIRMVAPDPVCREDQRPAGLEHAPGLGKIVGGNRNVFEHLG